MYYTEEEKLELKNKLQELLDKSDERIKAVFVSSSSVYTYSTERNIDEEFDLIDEVAKLFDIDENRLGGWSVASKESLRELGGYFYAERN